MRFAILLAAAAGAMLVAGCSNPFAPIVPNNNGSSTATNSQNAARTADATRDEDRARGGEGVGGTEGSAAPAPADGGKPADEGGGGPTASVSSEITVSEQWFVGRWSDYSDCRDPIDFRSNGTFITAANARGNWRVEDGGELVLSGAGGVRRMRLTPVGSDQVRTDQGGASYRCD